MSNGIGYLLEMFSAHYGEPLLHVVVVHANMVEELMLVLMTMINNS